MCLSAQIRARSGTGVLRSRSLNNLKLSGRFILLEKVMVMEEWQIFVCDGWMLMTNKMQQINDNQLDRIEIVLERGRK